MIKAHIWSLWMVLKGNILPKSLPLIFESHQMQYLKELFGNQTKNICEILDPYQIAHLFHLLSDIQAFGSNPQLVFIVHFLIWRQFQLIWRNLAIFAKKSPKLPLNLNSSNCYRILAHCQSSLKTRSEFNWQALQCKFWFRSYKLLTNRVVLSAPGFQVMSAKF